MKKIIAAFDGLKYSASTQAYSIEVARHSDAHLIGIFLDDPAYNSFNTYDLMVKRQLPESSIRDYQARDLATRTAAANDFEKACRQAGISYSIHHNRNVAIQELKHESIYADLLIIDCRESLSIRKQKPPTRFIRDLLAEVQCPVLLVPPKFRAIDKLVLLYDGAPASVYAIKMFSYLLPQFAALEPEVISVNPLNSTLHLPDNKLMKEFMKRHFPSAVYKVSKGWAETEIVRHLQDEGANALLVLGAYSRGTVSRWFHESMADILMRELKLPMFIAHHK